MKTSVLFCLALLSFTLLSAVYQETRQTALLQREHFRNGYSSSITVEDTFSYSDSLNGFFIPGSFVRHYQQSFEGSITEWDEPFVENHNITYLGTDVRIDFDVVGLNTGDLTQQYSYVLNDRNQLKFYFESSSNNDYSITWFYHEESGITDSIIFRDSENSYTKYIFEHDALNRVSNNHIYSSSDSLSWNCNYIDSFLYGDPLPYALTLVQPEIINPSFYNTLSTVVDANYQILSRQRYYVSNGSSGTSNYVYTTYNSTSGYWIEMNEFMFDQLGRFTCQSILATNDATERYSFTWGDYVSNQDEIAAPHCVTIYPNPFCQNLKICLSSKDNTPSEVSIYNVKGQLIRQWQSTSAKEVVWDGKDSASLAVSSGIYLVRVKQGNRLSTAKTLRL